MRPVLIPAVLAAALSTLTPVAATAAGGPPTAAIGVSATAAANAAAAGTGVADPGVAATPVPPYTTQIVRTQQWRRTMGGVEYQFSQFENRAYRCGRTGVFTFLLLERAGEPNRSAPLWVRLHGGGVGYYLPDGTYLGGEAHNDQESADFLAGVVLRDIGEDAGKNTIVGRRLREGARVLATAMCDHDVRSGLGTPYPNNPHHADTVAGALADMAAIDAVANGATGIARRPTTQIFLVGGSAGAIGAWSVAHNLNARGVRLTGAIGDAGVFATRSTVLHDRRLTPQTRDPRWRWQDQAVKIGPYATQPALAPERVLPAGFPVPFLDVYMDQDPHCAGQHPVVPEAVADGYANNCRWVHGAVSEAVASPRQRSIGYPGPGHTITTIEGHPVQADAEAWYRAVMASSPGPVIW